MTTWIAFSPHYGHAFTGRTEKDAKRAALAGVFGSPSPRTWSQMAKHGWRCVEVPHG